MPPKPIAYSDYVHTSYALIKLGKLHPSNEPICYDNWLCLTVKRKQDVMQALHALLLTEK